MAENGVQIDQSLEYELLQIIEKVNEPVGASSLALTLKTPQATIGRKLHELEFEGYLKKQSNKGRVITEDGKSRLKMLRNDALRQAKVTELLNESSINSEQDLLDILYARRLIEREIAFLAAHKITQEECKRLEKILADQRLDIKYGELGDQQDLEFHRVLGQIAGNKILGQIVSLITTQSHAYLEFSYISKKFESAVKDHEAVLECLIKKDAEGAAKAMVEHIDRVIVDVKKYFNKNQSDRK